MRELRRRLLKGSAAALLSPLIGTGLLLPGRALAGEWNRPAFTAHHVTEALKTMGMANAAESRDIVIIAPEIAENGAKVDIEISSNLPGTRSLTVFADKNPMPLAATLEFTGNALPYARLQLKMAESTRLRVVAKTVEGKSHVAFRDIKVTLGGCGG